VQTTKVEKVESSQNGAAMKTGLVEGNNGKDIIQRTEVLNSDRNGGVVPKTQVFKGANDSDIVQRTRFVKDDKLENALSMDDINDLVQSFSGLQRYLPLLSVFPEVHFLTPFSCPYLLKLHLFFYSQGLQTDCGWLILFLSGDEHFDVVCFMFVVYARVGF